MCVLQGTFGSLPSHAALLNESIKLKADSEDLRTKAVAETGDLNYELDAVRKLEAEAEQVSCPRSESEGVTKCSTESLT